MAFTNNCFTKDVISSYSISVFMSHIIDFLSQTNGQVENEESRVGSVECGKQEIVEMRSVESTEYGKNKRISVIHRSFSLSRNKKLNWKPSSGRS